VIPWLALALASFSLVFSLMSWFWRSDGSGQPPPPMMRMSESQGVPAPGSSGPPDLSTMTPREAADRLFNRVMMASERGNSAEVQQFAPMAVQAYERAGAQDNDARYHVALIHLATGDLKKTRASLDRLRKAVPNHLLGLMLEHELAARRGDKEKADGIFRAFLKAYDSEIAKGRQEYADHGSNIERFRAAAQASVSEKK